MKLKQQWQSIVVSRTVVSSSETQAAKANNDISLRAGIFLGNRTERWSGESDYWCYKKCYFGFFRIWIMHQASGGWFVILGHLNKMDLTGLPVHWWFCPRPGTHGLFLPVHVGCRGLHACGVHTDNAAVTLLLPAPSLCIEFASITAINNDDDVSFVYPQSERERERENILPSPDILSCRWKAGTSIEIWTDHFHSLLLLRIARVMCKKWITYCSHGQCVPGVMIFLVHIWLLRQKWNKFTNKT